MLKLNINWAGMKDFGKQAFSENGSPSSSRLISAWLSVSSMALIWWCVKHAMNLQDNAKIITWVSGIPQIIYALAAFTVAPYGVNQLKAAISSFKRDKED